MKEIEIHYGSLPNDVRHLQVRVPHRETTVCAVMVKTGSRNEVTKKEWGISHSLEHKVFRGTERHTEKEWASSVGRLGLIQDANTDREYTTYYSIGESSDVARSMGLLAEAIVGPSLTRNHMKKENGVLAGEIGDANDDFKEVTNDLFEGLLYEGSNIAQPVYGTKETVVSQTKRDLTRYMEKWYKGANVLVVLVGKVGRLGSLVEKDFGSLPAGPIEPYLGTAKYGENRQRVLTKNTEQVYFMLGVPGVAMNDPRYQTVRIIERILGGSDVQSSRLYEEVRTKKGAAYDIKAASDSGSDVGYLAVGGPVAPRLFHSTLDIVNKKFFGLAEKITSDEVRQAKKYLKIQTIRVAEDTLNLAYLIGIPALMFNVVEHPVKTLEQIESVTLSDVRRVAKELLVPDQARLAVLGPFDADLKRVKEGE